MLADKEEIYELQTHNIRPDSTDKYLKNWYVNTLISNIIFSFFLKNLNNPDFISFAVRKMQV